MRQPIVEYLECNLLYCEHVNSTGGARQVLALIRELGGEFLDFASFRVHPDPTTTIDAKGSSIAWLEVQHELLLPDVTTLNAIAAKELPPDAKGMAGFGFIQATRAISLFQDVSFRDRTKVDFAAEAQLAFALLLYPHVRPKFGWIDEPSLNEPSEESIAATELPYIFWATIFGPEYVRQLGRDFLLGAPVYEIRELDDGGILYVTSESYLEWWSVDFDHIEDYFRPKVPYIKQYRAEEKID
jgi:hypothetical protein